MAPGFQPWATWLEGTALICRRVHRRVVQAEVVTLLREMAEAMRGMGESHRSRAYGRAADAVDALDRAAFAQLMAGRRWTSLPGVGAKMAQLIEAFLFDGAVPEELAAAKRRSAANAASLDEATAAFVAAPFAGVPELHCHTTWSDGDAGLEEMVLVARALGANAIGISDHSGSLRVARGLDAERVRLQWDAIDRLQDDRPDMRILKGTECDIMADGSLDHPDDLLEGFDYVIASLHSALRMDAETMTRRLVRAISHPHVTIIGHPTTRRVGVRRGAALDLDVVFAAAAQHGVALEVNGNPGRQDLSVELARAALAAGCQLSLGSDAHDARELLHLAAARTAAHAAGAQENDIINFALAGLPP